MAKAIEFGRWTVSHPGDEKTGTKPESYVWEPDEMTLGECFTVEEETGLSFREWVNAVDPQRRAIACQVLIWYLRKKAGIEQDRATVDFPLRKLSIVEIKPVEGDEADPEAPAGSEPATE